MPPHPLHHPIGVSLGALFDYPEESFLILKFSSNSLVHLWKAIDFQLKMLIKPLPQTPLQVFLLRVEERGLK